VVIVVMVDEPKGIHYGGLIAGPVFKSIAEASLDYLGIERELPPPSDKLDDFFDAYDDTTPDDAPEESARNAAVPTLPGAMPDLRGLPLRTAMRTLASLGVDVKVQGHGFVVSHHPSPGDALDPAAPVQLQLAATL